MIHSPSRRAVRISLLPLLCVALFALTPAAADDVKPVSSASLTRVLWHPAGKQITYIRRHTKGNRSNDALWAYDIDAATETLLLDPQAEGTDGKPKAPAWTFAGYQWSPDGNALLVTGGRDLWLVPTNGEEPRRLTHDEAAEEHPTISPDGARVAFIRQNDLFVVDVKSGQTTQLTFNGSDTVLNGKLDWVYGEELGHLTGTDRSYEWSPDGSRIVYLRLDQSAVPEFPLVDILKTHPQLTRQRYPKAGDKNSKASVFVVTVDIATPVTKPLSLPAAAEYVLPEFTWTSDGTTVHVMTLNRGQNELTVSAWNPRSEEPPRVLLQERDDAWLDVFEGPRYLKSRSEFVWLSERDGWLHAYLYDQTGTVRRQLTRGNWQIEPGAMHAALARPFECDPSGEWGYFAATEADPRERQIYRVRFDGSAFERLTPEPGTHALQLSPDGRHLIDSYSSVDQPPVTRVLRADGKQVALLHRNEPPRNETPQPTHEFHEVTAADGTKLYARLTKPAGFDPAKKYPVIVYVYGGPQLQLVRNTWGGSPSSRSRLPRDGFLIWSLDNRGSSGRGQAFETAVFRNLGEKELADQLDGLAYLKTLPFVDAKRFGLYGWSYGGYMTLYALTHAPDAFVCGVAGAPVTDWKLYDTIYTERYMRTPAENPDGYRRASPVTSAAQLKSRLLLIHGTADDNVHTQNTMLFLDALIQAGKHCELQIQPGQKHGFAGAKANQYVSEGITEFFKRNLQGSGPFSGDTTIPDKPN